MGLLTTLRELHFYHGGWAFPHLHALQHLSSLTQLERLDFSSDDSPAGDSVDGLPADLVPALGQLTYLRLGLPHAPNQRIALLHPDGSGPALRELRLERVDVVQPGEGGGLFHALRHLERLRLKFVELAPALWEALPQLTALTLRYLMAALAEQLWAVLTGCSHLRDLALGADVRCPGSSRSAACSS